MEGERRVMFVKKGLEMKNMLVKEKGVGEGRKRKEDNSS